MNGKVHPGLEVRRDFLPSGVLPADTAGMLNWKRMSELMQDVKSRFDLVLVDSPPILGVSDASVIASEVDHAIIVIQYRKLPKKMLMRVRQALETVGCDVLGAVLSNVDIRSDSQYQYNTSYYTYYSPDKAVEGAAPAAMAAYDADSAPRSAEAARTGDDQGELYSWQWRLV